MSKWLESIWNAQGERSENRSTTRGGGRRLLRALRGAVLASLAALSVTVGLAHASPARAAASLPAAPPSQASCQATTETENVALARAWHEEVINRRNPAALQDILAATVVHHAAGGYPATLTAPGVAAMMGDFLTAFSDLSYSFDLFIVQDDYVVERYTATGTQDGPMANRPPSGRPATWTGINIFRIECGRIAEVWSEVDALSRDQQLTGAATSPVP